MGVFVMEPGVLEYLPRIEDLDFPELVRRLLSQGEHVGSYLCQGFLPDIGRHDDYERAIAEWEKDGP
jgi:NDP-sugar pyrophosphorylase family protein